jgi:hypothetical protein
MQLLDNLENPTTVVLIGGVIGAIAYVAAASAQRMTINPALVFEGCVAGGLLAAGMHLFFCVFDPQHLVHVFDKQHQQLDLTQYDVRIDAPHALDMLAGALTSIAFSSIGLYYVCKGVHLGQQHNAGNRH